MGAVNASCSVNLKAEWKHSKASFRIQLEFRRRVPQPSLLCDLLMRTGRRPASGPPSCAARAPQSHPGWRCLSGRSPNNEWHAASWTAARDARTAGWTPPPVDDAVHSDDSEEITETSQHTLWSAVTVDVCWQQIKHTMLHLIAYPMIS